MPGDEQKSRNRHENHARSGIISSTMSLQTIPTSKIFLNKNFVTVNSCVS